MAKTNFYLDLRGKAKDGKGSVLIRLYHNASATTFSTGIRVFPHEWDGENVIHNEDSYSLNATLQEKRSEINNKLRLLSLREDFQRLTAAEIKSKIQEKKVRSIITGHLLSDIFADYLSTGELKEKTREIYDITLKKIKDFSGDIRIESLDLRWLRSFDQYLAKRQGINGKSIYLRSLRAVLNYARHTGLACPYPFENFQIKSEPTQKRSVSVELLRRFRDFPTNEYNSKMRDYFFLMFYLIGINSKDLLLAKKSQVANGRLEYIREKTGKKYSVKIEPEAEELLERYRGKGDFLLEAMDHCKHYKSFARQINDGIQNIGEEVPKENIATDLFSLPTVDIVLNPVIPGITTYYARHCWATFAYEIGISIDTISQALGHSMGNRTTLIYVKPDQSKVDEANRKVIDYFTGPA